MSSRLLILFAVAWSLSQPAEAENASVELSLSRPAPWRIVDLPASTQIAIEADGADLEVIPGEAIVRGVKEADTEDGWTRVVLDLLRPMRKGSATLDPASGGDGEGARIRLMLEPSYTGEEPALPPREGSEEPLHIALDPGHGGIDPGAEADGLKEADLLLTFALELREILAKDGRFVVSLTREDDSFVPLEARISRARTSGADALLSLHADALPEGAGGAEGATVYTLSASASDRASRLLAERHDRDDLLAGVDLSGQGDTLSLVLMDLVRRDTAPRAERLADELVTALEASGRPLHPRPRRSAGFSVLKAPDIPSVLLELGFLSSPGDRARLTDPEWRRRTAEAIRDAFVAWDEGG